MTRSFITHSTLLLVNYYYQPMLLYLMLIIQGRYGRAMIFLYTWRCSALGAVDASCQDAAVLIFIA